MEQIIQCLSAFFACIGFAFVFRIHHHPRFAIIGSLGGSLGWIIYLLTIQSYGDVLANLIAMSCVALYSEIMARLLKAPATIFIILVVSLSFLERESIKPCFILFKVIMTYL